MKFEKVAACERAQHRCEDCHFQSRKKDSVHDSDGVPFASVILNFAVAKVNEKRPVSPRIFLTPAGTTNDLAVAHRTFFAVAANHVKLSLHNSAIVAAMLVCAPIILLLAVANAWILFATDDMRGLQLRHLNFLWPTFNHPFAVISDKLQPHKLCIVPKPAPRRELSQTEIDCDATAPLGIHLRLNIIDPLSRSNMRVRVEA